MRLKTFTATTMADAMRQVRAVLGEEAIILSTEQDKINKKVLVTAGVEDAPLVKQEIKQKFKTIKTTEAEAINSIMDVFDRHHLPRRLAHALLRRAEDFSGDILQILEEIIASSIAFTEEMPSERLLLLGQPGAGKTVTAAKLAAKARLAGKDVVLLSTDTVKAGGIEQLGNLARAMKVPLHTADDPKALSHALQHIPAKTLVVIDTAGLDPRTDSSMLKNIIKIPGVSMAWVLPVSGDADDLHEEGQALTAMFPISLLLPTRLDLARRLGGLMNVAITLGIPIGPVGMSMSIARGLRPISAALMASLMLADVAMPKGRFIEDAKS